MCESWNKIVYSCQPVSLSNPLSSYLLNLQYKSIVCFLILYFPVHSG